MAPKCGICADRIMALPLTRMGKNRRIRVRAQSHQKLEWGYIKFEVISRTLRGHTQEGVGYGSLKFKEEVELEI